MRIINKCSVILETVQAMLITFEMKIKGLCNVCQHYGLRLLLMSQQGLKLDTFLTCSLIVISRTIFKEIKGFKLSMTVRVCMHNTYDRAHFAVFDLDGRSQWLGRGK